MSSDIKFLLSFAPKETADELQKGLSPMFYHTLTYEGDLELHKRLDRIRAALAQAPEDNGND